MTETTSIQQFMRERHAFAPVRQPGLATFIAQAAVGSFCGTFVVLLVRILFVYQPRNGFFAFYVPFLMGLALATGALAGLLIWAGTKEADGRLLGITRTLMGVLVTGLAWFALWYFLSREEEISSEALLLMLAVVVVSGVSIGWVTGSRLRLWRELIRGGETKQPALRILAGLIGLVLRSVVVFLFLIYLIIAIASVQSYFFGTQPRLASEIRSMVWYLLFLGHFTTGAILLFARVRFWPLVLLTLISTAPVLASLWLVEMVSDEQYIVIGYLVAWAMFLVTRWRQTDVAMGVLNKELRYYLID